jgi:hypothetical protein
MPHALHIHDKQRLAPPSSRKSHNVSPAAARFRPAHPLCRLSLGADCSHIHTYSVAGVCRACRRRSARSQENHFCTESLFESRTASLVCDTFGDRTSSPALACVRTAAAHTPAGCGTTHSRQDRRLGSTKRTLLQLSRQRRQLQTQRLAPRMCRDTIHASHARCNPAPPTSNEGVSGEGDENRCSKKCVI